MTSGASVTMAFKDGFKFSMRLRYALATSTGESARLRMSSASLFAERETISSMNGLPWRLCGAVYFKDRQTSSAIIGGPLNAPRAPLTIHNHANQIPPSRPSDCFMSLRPRSPSTRVIRDPIPAKPATDNLKPKHLAEPDLKFQFLHFTVFGEGLD